MNKLDIGFHKWTCRVLFSEKFPDYVNKEEYFDDKYYYIVGENLDGKVAKAKFRKEYSLSSAFIMMYDAFFGNYIISERVA